MEIRPDYVPALINLGKLFLVGSRHAEAVEILKKAAAADPFSGRAYQLLGESYLLSGNYDLAIIAFQESLKLEPAAMVESRLRLAIAFDRVGKKQLAAREFQLYLEANPDHQDKEKLLKYIAAHSDKP